MRTYNKATIIGRIGSEIVLRNTKSGKAVVNMNIATNERRADGVENTVWHRTVLWDRLAEYADRYLNKGDAVYLEGRIGESAWVDKEGVKHLRTEITARELIGLASRGGDPEAIRRSEGGATLGRPPGQAEDGAETAEVMDQIPF